MHTLADKTIKAAFFTAVLLCVAPCVQAAPDSVTVRSTSGVADMLQRKQETQLHEQLVREGRWDDVKKLDEARAQRTQAQRDQIYLRANAEIAHGSGTDGPQIDARATDCDPADLRIK